MMHWLAFRLLTGQASMLAKIRTHTWNVPVEVATSIVSGSSHPDYPSYLDCILSGSCGSHPLY